MSERVQPEVRFIDGKPVYFYTLNQLEAIRDKWMFQAEDREVSENFNRHTGSVNAHLMRARQ